MEYILNDVLEIKNGKNQKAVENSEGQYPIYGSGGVIGYADDYICDADTVVIGRKGSINNPIYVSEPFWNVDTAFGLVARREVLLPRYLFYFCKKFDFEKLNKTVTIPSLTKCDLLNIKIKLPDIDEQQLVVDKLIRIESVMELRKQELNVLDNLIKARFVEMFGDYINEGGKPLSELATITGGLTKNSKRNTFNLKMPYLRVANVFFNRLDLNEILEIGVREDEIGKTLLEAGDLLFVEGNGSIEQIGRVAIWDGSINQILHQNHLIKARFHKKTILPEYALFYFMSQEGRQQIISKSVSTSGLNTLSVNKISSLILPMPPIELQERFAAFVTQVNKSKVAVQKALDETQMLFDSLMQKYFA